jgi:undecaprenyl diphosphate synthase
LRQSQKDKREQTARRLGISPQQVPRSIAVIMDGNGRWARKRGLPRVEGHRAGGKTTEQISQFCVDLGIEYLFLYSFSAENWKRPAGEVQALMYIHTRYIVEVRPKLMENNVRVVHIGRIDRLPAKLREELAKTMEMTGGNTGMTLALALNYGGRAEITDAVGRIARLCREGRLDPRDIDEDCVAGNLYTAGMPDPDLLIRTSNEMRVSNFLLWQISYAEFWVTQTLWPDFSDGDLEEAIAAYAARKRRFGSI